MANADLAPGALQVEKRPKSSAKADRKVYQAVAERDGYRCRACGEYGGIDIHRHHIRGRKFTTMADVACLCETCHAYTHVRIGGKRLLVSGDADERNGLTLHFRDATGQWHEERR